MLGVEVKPHGAVVVVLHLGELLGEGQPEGLNLVVDDQRAGLVRERENVAEVGVHAGALAVVEALDGVDDRLDLVPAKVPALAVGEETSAGCDGVEAWQRAPCEVGAEGGTGCLSEQGAERVVRHRASRPESATAITARLFR